MRKLTAAALVMAIATAILLLLPAPDSTSRAYSLDARPGVSVTALPGSVLLEWTEPPLAGITGYVIRRGMAPGQEDRWPINDFPVVGTSYRDRNVLPGATYHYVIIPLLSDGTWSPASREVAVTPLPIPEGYRLVQIRMDEAEATLITHEGEQAIPLLGKPLLDRGRVLVPLEDLAALLGAPLSRSPETGIISLRLASGREMQMEVGNCCLIFGQAVRDDICSPLEREGTVYLPLRWVAEAMEGKLLFDTLSRTVTIEIAPAR